MRHLSRLAVGLRTVVNDTRGQDLFEYALMAGFVALATTTMVPGITSSINAVLSKVNSVMILACVQLGSVRWMKPQSQEAFSGDCR
jgi:Flp pilus assembly pilin Flp